MSTATMRRREALKRLEELGQRETSEEGHGEADDILRELVALYVPSGDEIVKAYDAIPKWYA